MVYALNDLLLVIWQQITHYTTAVAAEDQSIRHSKHTSTVHTTVFTYSVALWMSGNNHTQNHYRHIYVHHRPH